MAWLEVRRQHKLLFRFDPELELIEVKVKGRLEVIQLDDYRPLRRRTGHSPLETGLTSSGTRARLNTTAG
jgi:hypothetical protein